MPSTSQSRKPGGRPRKHATPEAVAAAKKKSDQQRYQRSRQPPRPANFIAYEPLLCADVPTNTRTEIGLRTSANIPIPQASESQLSNKLLSLQANYPPPTTTFTAIEGTDMGEQVGEVYAREQEANAEQDKYNAAILKRADELDAIAAEALLEMRLGRGADKGAGYKA